MLHWKKNTRSHTIRLMRKVIRPESGLDVVDDVILPQIQTSLIAWYEANARDLPWRHTRDPYAILVSEIMLQQIQVSRAIPFYLAFLERFPTVHTSRRHRSPT